MTRAQIAKVRVPFLVIVPHKVRIVFDLNKLATLTPATLAVKRSEHDRPPDRAVRYYLAAFHLAAVHITVPKSDTPCGLGAGTALPGRSAHRGVLWTDSLQVARDVVAMVIGCNLRGAPRAGNLLAVTVPTAAAAIDAPRGGYRCS
jgi:hypothetical protein